MEPWSPFEDERGVDVSQIRDQLRMSVQERVREMIRVSNIVLDVQRHVREHP